MLPIQFQINTGSSEPIYRQLMDQLRRRVAAGQWVAGQALPSVRELAAELTLHPMTISKAYSLLELEGLLERRRGLPMVIAAAHAKAAPGRERITDALICWRSLSAKMIGLCASITSMVICALARIGTKFGRNSSTV